MRRKELVPSVDDRLGALERQVMWWRRATVCALFMLAVGGTMAFRRFAPVALEASSLTLRAAQGGAVVLSLRPSGDMEARFSGTGNPNLRGSGGSGLALVNPSGREVLRIGDVSAQQLGR